jgi:hypothetical protein
MSSIRQISPKYLYYFGILFYIAVVGFLTFLFKESITTDERAAKIILGGLASASFLWLLFYLNRFVFLTVDCMAGKIHFGNLFFSTTAMLRDVIVTGHVLWYRRMVIFRVGKKKLFTIVPLNSDVEYLRSRTY